MTIEEITKLLLRIQVLDNRQVDQLTIEAWTPLMATIPYSGAVDAVNEHFRTSTEYLQPAHIVRAVTEKRMIRPETMSPEVPEDCGHHRWVADGTCMFCLTKRVA